MTQADKMKKETTIVGACSTQWAVSLRPVNQLCNMTDTKLLAWFCHLAYLQIILRFIINPLRILQYWLSSPLYRVQLLVTVNTAASFFVSFLSLHNLWGCLTHRPNYFLISWPSYEECNALMVSVGFINQYLWKNCPLIQMLNVHSEPTSAQRWRWCSTAPLCEWYWLWKLRSESRTTTLTNVVLFSDRREK